MAKKKSSKATAKASHWHRHHTVSHHMGKAPFFTLSVLLLIVSLLVTIWLTLYVGVNYNPSTFFSVSPTPSPISNLR